MTLSKFFRKNIALPGDHGSWVFLLSPLLIGIFASGEWTSASLLLIVAALAAFLIRQPTSIAVKAYTGRRSQQDLPAARFWFLVYAFIGLGALGNLIRLGYAFILILAVPGILVFIWHLRLVSKRQERRQMGVDIIASGTLALAAPAAFWLGTGNPDPLGWWLWGLTWLQSAASIVYAFLRLEQRVLEEPPSSKTKLKLAQRALLYTTFNLLLSIVLAILKIIPSFIWIPFALQWIETIWGTFNPAIGQKPTRIGLRQLAVSTLFTILFILVWQK